MAHHSLLAPLVLFWNEVLENLCLLEKEVEPVLGAVSLQPRKPKTTGRSNAALCTP